MQIYQVQVILQYAVCITNFETWVYELVTLYEVHKKSNCVPFLKCEKVNKCCHLSSCNLWLATKA